MELRATVGKNGVQKTLNSTEPVSYTHLDVYKRQGIRLAYPKNKTNAINKRGQTIQ